MLVYNHGLVLMVALMGSTQFYQASINQGIFIKALKKKSKPLLIF